MREAQTLIRVSGLSRSFGSQSVLKDVSLTVRSGERVGIRGASGSGKTTLAAILAGLDTGFEGTRVCAPGVPHLVMQDSLQSLNPRLAVKWSLAEARAAAVRNQSDRSVQAAHGSRFRPLLSTILRRDYQRIADALTEVGLSEDLLNARPGQLSGGQRQRVAIARALLSGAHVLILDEPVAALDPSIQARILNLLQRISVDTRLGMVIISHDHDVLDFLCERQLQLQGGRLWQYDT